MKQELTLDKIVKSEDLFSSLNKEKSPEKERKIEIIKNKIYHEIYNDLCLFKESINKYDTIHEMYLKLIKNIKSYSSKDITEFLIITDVNNMGRDFLGTFLSALINKSNDKNFILNTQSIAKGIHFIGIYNEKNIEINGNVGTYLGYKMTRGKIVVNGNVDLYAGCNMKNGEIHINGKALGYIIENIGGNIFLNGLQVIKNGKKYEGVVDRRI